MAARLEVFTLEAVTAATGAWSKVNKLGSGGFGNVYAGRLDGREVAVKRLRLGEHGKAAGSSQVRAAPGLRGARRGAAAAAWGARGALGAAFWRHGGARAFLPCETPAQRRTPLPAGAQGNAEFLTEVAYAVLIQHPNLLPVLGIVRAARAARGGLAYAAERLRFRPAAFCRRAARLPVRPPPDASDALVRPPPRRWTPQNAVWCTRSCVGAP
jgi:hypothetical protein